jgi:hypothetical protein
MKKTVLFLFLAALVPFSDACKRDYRENILSVKPEHFLSSSKFEKLEVEIVYVEGYQPTQQAIDHLTNLLSARLNKPAGIFVHMRGVGSPAKTSFSTEDLREVEKRHRSEFTKGKTISAFVFFADAPYAGNSGNSQALGVAYGSTSIGIFQKTVQDFSGGFGQPERFLLEATTIEHEFGHLFGLVDYGTDMQTAHKDEAHGHHCTNEDCLMYYLAETSDFISNLLPGSPVPEFDANCLSDLRANGGK